MTVSNSQSRLLVWHPFFLGGGAEAVTLWMLEALCDDYDVTLLTLFDVDLQRLNAMYDTQLQPQTLTVKAVIPSAWSGVGRWALANSSVLRAVMMHGSIRTLKTMGQHYDGVISGYNGVDFGRPGLQYMHWVRVVEGGKLQQNAPFRKLCHGISDFSVERLRQNVSLVNSAYTGQRVQKDYDIPSVVVYPPVVADIPQRPWSQKQDSFLCSGRLVPAKMPHRAIRILRQVRRQGFDVKLYITGGGGGVYGREYVNRIKQLVAAEADWIQLLAGLPYQEYLALLAQCRYGIHYKPEPFGISIAEMVQAGMIPFVRSRGGQVEIVGAEQQQLMFNSESEAVSKIVAMLKHPDQQQRSLAALAQQQSLFSVEHFQRQLRGIVADYLAGKALLP
ncbi:hypothetical protein XM38_024280 [Halomicronema hongdechloris C2206]|uniref:Glycosyl transferase family 1 domain-containing protein n=2 Tax=Halomicronema hongdechloris TaxID=1209493 RepID=A0A1Z3HMK0_9CYAN|nr:hypothetical protein XM38_024280 [Halomicronema hongdechloris C2206]